MTSLALAGFAANSLLCRAALRAGAIDAATFAAVRFVAGAVVLAAIARPRAAAAEGSWASAMALAVYAIAFSLAYLAMGAGVGAFTLFGAVQATMLGWGVLRGERLGVAGWIGFAVALAGLVALTIPGGSAPPPAATGAMAIAGVAWGAYSLRGRGATRPLAATAGNFLRAAPLTAAAAGIAALRAAAHADGFGLACACASGAIASGLGYACWYAALPSLGALRGGVVQLLVPMLTAVIATLALGEAWSARLVLGATAIVAGVAVALLARRR